MATYTVCKNKILAVTNEYDVQEAIAAFADPDIMYLHQAKREPNWNRSREAMQQKVSAHKDSKHWELVPRDLVPEGTNILPAVWSMKRKRQISTRQIYKWKASFNVHGGKQIHF